MTTREGRLADGQLYYRVWDADAPRAAVVLAHGYAEHSGRYEHVGGALAGAGFSTYALDHFGHGQSEGERADIGSLTRAVANLDALVDLVAAEADDRPLFLLGHSMGGLIATAYTEEHQERLRGLVLSGAALNVAPELLALRDLAEIPALPLAPLVSRDPEVVKDYENDPLNYLGPMPRAMLDAFAEIPAVLERVKEISIPILVMHGEADALVPAQASDEVMAVVSSADKTLKIWPGAYHEIYNEPERAEVIATTIDWLSARV
ncbi:MAG TPA: alpha/beta hydrolase [Acidimicrobiales bacterium]|nr:alpha/beta hydrolase [Acidimicrobiales bacterium]